MIDQIASDPDGLDWLRAPHATARARFWKLAGAPVRVTVDLDSTLLTAHSDKEGAEATWKRGYGFHPMLAYCDETGEALAGELRPGDAGANTAADQIAIAEAAIQQIPVEHIATVEILLRVDSAGACHELLDWCRDARIGYSVGYDLTEPVRAAIAEIADDAGVCSLDQDGSERPNGQVAEITEHLDLTSWPDGSRVIVRRERAHPGAQLSFTDVDRHRFQAILTDQTGDIAILEQGHRARARVEDHIRTAPDETGRPGWRTIRARSSLEGEAVSRFGAPVGYRSVSRKGRSSAWRVRNARALPNGGVPVLGSSECAQRAV